MLWDHYGDLRTMAHLSLCPSLFPGWDNEAWNQGEASQLDASAQLQSLVKTEGCKVRCWAGGLELETRLRCLFSFHLYSSAFRSRDCEEGQGEGDRWEVCVADVAW